MLQRGSPIGQGCLAGVGIQVCSPVCKPVSNGGDDAGVPNEV